jgi:hypothetical protein
MRKLRSISLGTLLALGSCAALSAEERELKYRSELEAEYILKFDDSRISVSQLREIVWLSPKFDAQIGSPFQMTWESTPSANGVVFDKWLVVPELESCNPGYLECGHPDLNAAFLKNAAVNLERGKREVEILRRLKLPPVLEPVRTYLMENLKFFQKLEEVRYTYLQTGEVRPMRQLLCKYCPCEAEEEKLLNELANTPDGATRRRLSLYQWYNDVLHCHTKSLPHKYPVDAWDRFLEQFHITESIRSLSPD